MQVDPEKYKRLQRLLQHHIKALHRSVKRNNVTMLEIARAIETLPDDQQQKMSEACEKMDRACWCGRHFNRGYDEQPKEPEDEICDK